MTHNYSLRFVGWVLGLAVGLALVVGIAMRLAHSDGYPCLLWSSIKHDGGSQTLEVATGAVLHTPTLGRPPDYLTVPSPDGRYLAYDYPWSDESGNPDPNAWLYVENVATGKRIGLHPVADTYAPVIRWSADSQWIASISWAPHTGQDWTDPNFLNLSIAHPDGSDVHAIFSSDVDGFFPDTLPLIDSASAVLRWSADGKYLSVNGVANRTNEIFI